MTNKGYAEPMSMSEKVKRVSYSPFLASCVRALGLRGLARSAYARWRGAPRVLRFSCQGNTVGFPVRTPLDLRLVESTWFGETGMLSDVLSRLNAGDVFLDAGSNLGMFALFAAGAVGAHGSVYAFEPEAAAHRRLVENVRFNKLENVRIFKKALSSSRGTRTLLLGEPDAVSQSAHISGSAGHGETVEIIDYDWLVENQDFPVPAIVKMDVEGHEFHALEGMRRTLSDPRCGALFCELHPEQLPAGVTAEKVLRLIRSFGFTTLQTGKRNKQIHATAAREPMQESAETKSRAISRGGNQR